MNYKIIIVYLKKKKLADDNCNLGSLEIRVSTYISAKLKKRTYMYDSLQFPVEINTRGSNTLLAN